MALRRYTKEFGDEAHRWIQNEYQSLNPGAIAGSTTGILGTLKPDIFDPIRGIYMEIKPLSLSGVAAGVSQMKAYDLVYGIGMGFGRGSWPDYPRSGFVFTTPILYWNVNGIIFYTDATSSEDDLIKLTTFAAVRAALRSGIFSRTLTGASVRIGGLVSARTSGDTARLQQHVGIAAILGTMGGF